MKSIKHYDFDLQKACFSQQTPVLLQRIYAARGVYQQQELSYSLAELPGVNLFKNIQQAVDLLVTSIEAKKRILIVGDFDADGATSSALALLALKQMGADWVDFLVPNRFDYGYGLTPELVTVAQQQQPDLIITVDNGITSIAGVAAAKHLGIQVLVTDHHLAGEELPDADAILNPNQPGCDFPSKYLAGVGVVFYLLIAVRQQLSKQGWFNQQGLTPPNMAHYLDLVALGTVADVVPLDHCNRILVKQGLARIRAGHCRPGIQALIQVANRQPQHLVAADLGFALGPRLNAAGRLDDMSIGIQCLISRGLQQALPLAQQLDQMNQQRRQLESQMQNQALVALQQLEQPKQQTAMPTGLCIYHEQWHQGVVGILAARIKERYHRPVVAFAKADSQNLKGSARSIPGLHIRDLLATIDAQHPQLIDKFGGHAMAAGLSLKLAKLAQFKEVFNQLAKEQLSTEDLQQVIYSDGSLNSDDFSLKRAHQLIAGGPWGQHFAEPLFDDQFEILEQKVLAEKHLKLIVTVPETNQLVEAIAFNVDRDLWPNPCQQAHLVYRLNVNHYRGQQKLQLLVEALWPLAENSCKIDQSTG